MSFFSDKKIGGQVGPLPYPFSSKSSDQNFKIEILFIIVERPDNYVFGCNMTPPPPTGPGEGSLNYKSCPLFTHCICYWEACIHFRVGRIVRAWCKQYCLKRFKTEKNSIAFQPSTCSYKWVIRGFFFELDKFLPRVLKIIRDIEDFELSRFELLRVDNSPSIHQHVYINECQHQKP